ncbi:MAG TPA: DUF5684 domain-containing protein [Candidatus Saccharimonadales bacterium]|nr:DUF5684 domain-containing protein [Candidatus Saccharimonadales bacterium]
MIAALSTLAQTYTTYSYDTPSSSGVSPVIVILYLLAIVATIAGLWKVFSKAGKPGWASIVPIYNTLVLLEIAGKPWWWLLLMFIPFVNIVMVVIVYNELSKAFGKGVGNTVGMLLLPFVFLPMLGFGDAKYHGGAPTAPTASVPPVAPSAPTPPAAPSV